MTLPTTKRHLIFAIPGDIRTRSGGYGYDREMIDALRLLGWKVEHLQLPAGFPKPSQQDLMSAAKALATVPDGSLVLVDGLAFGAMPGIALREAMRLKLVALVHHPLALETGLAEREADELRKSEMAALAAATGIIVTSFQTARTLEADFGVRREMICVVIPGTARSEAAKGSADDEPPMILAVGSLTPRKDHQMLVSALARVADRSWRCRIVGSDRMNVACAGALHEQVMLAGLADRIAITGVLEDVSAEYDRADIFALASRYEGFGMVFAEAMARGLPIIGCRGGAVPDLVPATAGVLVEPGDIGGFANALSRFLDDPHLRRGYAAGSLEAGRALPDWPASARALSDYLEQFR